jgi:hypothetical protein
VVAGEDVHPTAILVCRREHALQDSVHAYTRYPALAFSRLHIRFTGEPGKGIGIMRE